MERTQIAYNFMVTALSAGVIMDGNRAFELADGFIKASIIPELSVNVKGVTRPAEIQILDLLNRDKFIEAIKLYRACTGLSLKEAKDEMDRVRGRL